jgi:hypothetical protein
MIYVYSTSANGGGEVDVVTYANATSKLWIYDFDAKTVKVNWNYNPNQWYHIQLFLYRGPITIGTMKLMIDSVTMLDTTYFNTANGDIGDRYPLTSFECGGVITTTASYDMLHANFIDNLIVTGFKTTYTSETFETNSLANWYGYFSVPNWHSPTQGLYINDTYHYNGIRSLSFVQGSACVNAINSTKTELHEIWVTYAIKFVEYVTAGKKFEVVTEFLDKPAGNYELTYGGTYIGFGDGATYSTLNFEYGSSLTSLANTTNLNANTWYKIKYHVVVLGNNCLFEGFVDGVLTSRIYGLANSTFINDPTYTKTSTSVIHTYVNKSQVSHDAITLDDLKVEGPIAPFIPTTGSYVVSHSVTNADGPNL